MKYTMEAVRLWAVEGNNLRTLAIITDLLEGKTAYSVAKKYNMTAQGVNHIKQKYKAYCEY